MGRGGFADRGSANSHRAGDDVKLFAIHIVPTRPGALLHEIGHQVHNAGDRCDPCSQSAPQIRAIDTADRLGTRGEGIIPPQYADYLTHPAEIFARAFDASVTALQSPAQTGGSLSSVGVPSLTPTGEELAAFMADMKTVVLENRSKAIITDDARRSPHRPAPMPAIGI